jgi:3-hydroxyisobutyrate dehydrogenase-like beta-hydroxyacid dehydrogenase
VERGNLRTPLHVFNRTEARAIELRDAVPEGKITVASTAEEAILNSDLIFICLNSYKATEEILADCVKMGANLLQGKVFVDCSTVHPDLTRALATALGKSGAAFVACPLLGVPSMAASGQLVCLLAGPPSALERVKPYLDGVVSRAHIVVSDTDAGLASTLKIVANTFVLSMVEALAEGHTLAEKAGVGSGPLEQVLGFTFPGLHQLYSNTMSSGDYHKVDEVQLYCVPFPSLPFNHSIRGFTGG